MTLMATERVPYDAEHVIYRDFGDTVDAVWIGDPDIAHQLRTGDRDTYVRLFLDSRLSVELVGHLRRVYKSHGHVQGGWLLHTRGSEDYVATRKADALAALDAAVADYFNR